MKIFMLLATAFLFSAGAAAAECSWGNYSETVAEGKIPPLTDDGETADS
ncbi:MAG: hypothetical protein AAGA32_02620 [Pseudomonadota bacterium]